MKQKLEIDLFTLNTILLLNYIKLEKDKEKYYPNFLRWLITIKYMLYIILHLWMNLRVFLKNLSACYVKHRVNVIKWKIELIIL